MALSKRKLQIARLLILLILWGICTYVIVKLSVDYVETGSKNTIDIETERENDISVPWLYTPKFIGHKCTLKFEECSFLKWTTDDLVNCTTAIQNLIREDSYLVNSLLLRDLGISFTNPYDFLRVVFTVRYKDTWKLVNPNDSIPDSCESDASESSTRIALLGDDVIMTAIAYGETINELDRPAPVYIGFGNVASISYKLSQQQYINGTIKNSTEFATTQFRDLPKNEIVVHTLPASFDITKIKHKPGQSLLDLLGSIFGWIGIFTGTCIFSFLDTAIATYSEAESSKVNFFEKIKEKFITDTELCENSDPASRIRKIMEKVDMLQTEVDNLKCRGNTSPPLFTEMKQI